MKIFCIFAVVFVGGFNQILADGSVAEDTKCPTMCTMELNPVCAIKSDGTIGQFSNPCMFRVANCTSKGAYKSFTACPCPETVKQPVYSIQPVDTSQPVDSIQPVDSTQPVESTQPAPEIRPIYKPRPRPYPILVRDEPMPVQEDPSFCRFCRGEDVATTQ